MIGLHFNVDGGLAVQVSSSPNDVFVTELIIHILVANLNQNSVPVFTALADGEGDD